MKISPRRLRLTICLFALVFLAFAANARADWQSVGNVTRVAAIEQQSLVLDTSSGAKMRIWFYLLDAVRVTVAPNGKFETFAEYALEDKKRAGAAVKPLRQTASEIIFETVAGTKIVVKKSPLTISIFDSTGEKIVEDAAAAQFDRATGEIRAEKNRRAANETYYGFGEKALPLSRDGQTLTNWNTDAYRYTWGTDPLYQSIPFFIALDRGKSYGLFFHNTHRTTFDMGKTAPDKYSFAAAGGELDYFVFTGGKARSPKKVLEDYADLTGKMDLPPIWALGNQQSRFSYFPDSKVREIAAEFRKRKIPADAIYIDIDFMDGFRIFTWDKEKFPNPTGLTEDLAKIGFKSIVIVNPAVKKDDNFPLYAEGKANGYFVKKADGSEFNGSVWAGNSAFIDFTNPNARAWYGAKYKTFLDAGVAGFWNDMNEPSVFPDEKDNPVPLTNSPFKTIPLDARHAGDGAPGTHKRFHNVYGMMMARATVETLRKLEPNKRPFVLSRAGFSGIQRFAAVWTGDNTASWEHLQLSIPMLLNMSVSGVPFVGADVGGYSDNPSGELFARWLQAAALTPLLRPHAEKGTINKEPWEFGGDLEKINRASIELRYQLLPYIYTLFREHEQTGSPVMRPLWFEYPADAKTYLLEDQYLLGKDLLVAPVVRQGQTKRSVYFPAGDNWRDWQTGELYAGGTSKEIDAPLDKLPLFARVGAVIPTQTVVQHTGEMPSAPLTLNVIAGIAPERSEIAPVFQDAGDGYGYRGDAWRIVSVSHRKGLLTLERFGAFPAAQKIRFVEALGIEKKPTAIRVDGKNAELDFDAKRRRVTVEITDDAREISLTP